mgnify:CR=1 FL=1
MQRQKGVVVQSAYWFLEFVYSRQLESMLLANIGKVTLTHTKSLIFVKRRDKPILRILVGDD